MKVYEIPRNFKGIVRIESSLFHIFEKTTAIFAWVCRAIERWKCTKVSTEYFLIFWKKKSTNNFVIDLNSRYIPVEGEGVVQEVVFNCAEYFGACYTSKVINFIFLKKIKQLLSWFLILVGFNFLKDFLYNQMGRRSIAGTPQKLQPTPSWPWSGLGGLEFPLSTYLFLEWREKWKVEVKRNNFLVINFVVIAFNKMMEKALPQNERFSLIMGC